MALLRPLPPPPSRKGKLERPSKFAHATSLPYQPLCGAPNSEAIRPSNCSPMLVASSVSEVRAATSGSDHGSGRAAAASSFSIASDLAIFCSRRSITAPRRSIFVGKLGFGGPSGMGDDRHITRLLWGHQNRQDSRGTQGTSPQHSRASSGTGPDARIFHSVTRWQ